MKSGELDTREPNTLARYINVFLYTLLCWAMIIWFLSIEASLSLSLSLCT
jgi:hypothetical protein